MKHAVAPEIVVTDHALVRWLERVHGIDIAFMRKRLAETVRIAAVLGATGQCAVKLGGHRYVLDGNRLITVRPYGHGRAKHPREVAE